MKLAKAMATVGGLTTLSRIAGFVRDIMTAAFLGAGCVADAFFVALKLPNFFRRVTAEGAFSIVFVPMYSMKLETETPEKADIFASNAFMVMLTVLSIFTILAIIFMPYIIVAIAPGFLDDRERGNLAIELTRVTFSYLPLISLAALLGGILNAMDRFAPFAFAPVLFNVSLILALLLSYYFKTPGHALAWGLLVAGIFQLVFLFACVKRAGVRITLGFPRLDVDILKVLRLMGPAVIGAGVIHVNLFADVIIASFLEDGSISYLYYADRLNQLPLGVVGIAVGTTLLPMLSRAIFNKDKSKEKNLFNRALEYSFLLSLPASVALLIMPLILITVLFERGAFQASDSLISAGVLRAYAIGLPSYVAIKVFSTAHWARQDTITPVRISVLATLVNIALSILLINFVGIAGIALGTSLSGWLQFALYIRAFKKHDIPDFDNKFCINAPKIIMASCLMGGGVYILSAFFQEMILDGSLFIKIVLLFVIIISGIFTYAGLIFLMKIISPKDMKRYVLNK